MKAFPRIFKSIFCVSFIAFMSCVGACSQGPKPVVETRVTMPQSYPKEAVETYKQLAAYIPADTDMLAIAGYGSLADAVKQAQQWQIVDGDEFSKLLKDLGTHYLLNPARLETYFQAGMNVESGFAGGLYQRNPFFIFDVYDQKRFRAWFDNFVNEEFGRPRYHEMMEGSRRIVQVHILNRDFATLIEEPGKPVIITLGQGVLADAAPSLEAYHAMAESAHMADDTTAHEKFMKDMRDAPLAFWLKSDGTYFKLANLPEHLKELYPWSAGLGLALHFKASGPKLRAFCTWRERQFQDMPMGQWMASLTKGSSGDWAKTILNTKPSSMTRLLVNTELLESVVLPMMTEKQQRDYTSLKDKLTQRFLKLNISEQVIYNVGAAWLVLYEANATAVQNATTLDMVAAQDAAVFIPLKDAESANSFFAKVNILKGFVPKHLGTIELEGDVLHASLKLADGSPVHAAYKQGLIALSTDKAWSRVQKVMETSDAPANDSLFALDTHFFAMKLKMSDVTTILGTRFGIIREQIGEFLKPFELVEMHASANASSFEVVVEAPLAKSVQ